MARPTVSAVACDCWIAGAVFLAWLALVLSW